MNKKPFPNDEASLKAYERRVQHFTLGRLEKEWEAVKDDPTPERRDIVAKELREWDKTQKQAFRGLAKNLLFVFFGTWSMRNRVPLLVHRHYQTNAWRPSAPRNHICGLSPLLFLLVYYRLPNTLFLFHLGPKRKFFL